MIAKAEMPNLEVFECIYIGDRYVFSFMAKESDLLPPGTPIVCVDKENGEVTYMPNSPFENLDILDHGKQIPIT